jgi:protease-4
MTLTGVVLAVVLAAGDGGGLGFGSRVALLEIDGVIADDQAMLRQIREYRRDPSIKAFVVAINSPGGVVGPSQSIYQELRRLRDEDDRPVIASIGGMGASGGYYVALAADSIFALPGSITGSIGVIMEFPNASELMDKVGVDVEVVKSAEHKDAGSPFREITPEDRAVLNALVLDVYDQFVDAVASERSLSVAAVRTVADGRILSGRQALQAGLVDRLGNLQDALAAAGAMTGLGPDPRVVRQAEERFTVLDLIMGRGAAKAVQRWVAPWSGDATPQLKFVVPW